MSGLVEVEALRALPAANRLEQIAHEVADLLARTRPQLTAPPALSGGGPTAAQIMSSYGPQQENLDQALDVVAPNGHAVGTTSATIPTSSTRTT